jgi:putative Holliday junction resolvase
MRLMGIDYGSKRVGVASTDESGEFAIPRVVLKNDKSLLDEVLAIKDRESIDRIVVGESRNYAGEHNSIMEKILKFKEDLEQRGVVVELHPELLTSVEATRLQDDNDMADASAASLILKSYIDSQKNK